MLNNYFCFLINSLSSILYGREYNKFVNTKSIEQVQREKLMEILEKNKDTLYGIEYNFSSVTSVKEYRENVPITQYEDYEEYIEKIKNGEEGILTSEKVLLLEPTSGSTSPTKYIPYTGSLKKEFQNALKPWIYNLYSKNKGIKWGKSYWSISPVTKERQFTKGGIPIGFEEDSEYFGFLERKLFDQIFAVDGSVASVKDMDEFYFKTSLQLLMTKNLTLISVWNPTFLMLILEYIEKNIEKLHKEISFKDKNRAKEVIRLIEIKDFASIWKDLRVISCWCDGSAEKPSKKVGRIFPNAIIQPKGLLATEGVISIPFSGEEGSRIAINSHFYEFASIVDEKIYSCHELKVGQEYRVIITTSGGLYRYSLNDIVEVTDIVDGFPLIKFKGKGDKVSDLFGEKLNEVFLMNTIDKIGINPEFYMFAPEEDRYVLYISDNISENIDKALRENFHYDYCRKLGQLEELKIFKLNGNPYEEYIKGCVANGQKLGDIKSSALSLHGGWDKIFKGEYI